MIQQWQNINWLEKQSMNESLRSCLSFTGSLTRFLQNNCEGELELEVLTESWKAPLQEELLCLGVSESENIFIRETWLKSNEKKIVYARTIIPDETIKIPNADLTNLGTTPLGEVLFADETTRRSNVQYTRITEGSKLFEIIKNEDNTNETVWGRQSLFFIQDKPLLVCEVFLPTIIRCIKS